MKRLLFALAVLVLSLLPVACSESSSPTAVPGAPVLSTDSTSTTTTTDSTSRDGGYIGGGG